MFTENQGSAIRVHGVAYVPSSEHDLSLINCDFIANEYGVSLSGSLIAIDCSFVGNSSGAIGHHSDGGRDSYLLRCSFENNTSTGAGAIFLDLSSANTYLTGSAHLEQCEFSGNTGSSGAVRMNGHQTVLRVYDCVFTGNVATDRGGAISLTPTCGTLLTISNTTFIANSAEGRGGALNVHVDEEAGFIRVLNSRFVNNTAGTEGGAVYIWEQYGKDHFFHGCEFSGNTTARGGGLYRTTSYGLSFENRIINSTFFGNTATEQGGALHTGPGGGFGVFNCTVALNQSPLGAAIFNLGGTTLDVYNSILWDNNGDVDIVGVITFSHCNIDSAIPGVGNISLPPQFVDELNGDFRLLPDSPCIDSGSNLLVGSDMLDLDGDGDETELIPFDFLGLPRFLDDPNVEDCQFAEDCGEAPIIDMGAFEQVDSSIGDLDGDGIVGPADLAIILGNWGPCPDPPASCVADLDGDGVVGPADLGLLLATWG